MSKYESLFTQRVIEVIENRRRDRNMTIDDLCAATGIGRNSYYNKIRVDVLPVLKHRDSNTLLSC